MRRGDTISLLSLSLLAILGLASCGESLDPHSPDGALRSFAQTLVQGTTSEVMGHLSQPTKQALRDLTELSKLLNKKVDSLPLKVQAWARAEAMPKWMAERVDLNPVQVFEAVSAEMLRKIRSSSSDEVMQAFNARRVVYENSEEGLVHLKTRGFTMVKMRKEGDVWRFASLEDNLLDAVKTAQANLKMIEKNRQEVKRRQRLNLALPKGKSRD